jgi:electron transfer flavoprotein alpha subunit
MGVILSYVAIQDGKIKRSSLEVLSHSRAVAKLGGHTVKAIIIDQAASTFVSSITEYGPDEIITITNAVFDTHRNEPLCAALAAVIAKENPVLVTFASTEAVKDILGALAVRTGAAAIPDVSSYELTSDGVLSLRPVMASKVLASTISKSSITLVSVRSGSYDVVLEYGAPNVSAFDFSYDVSGMRVDLKEVKTATGGTVDLSEAEVVIAAGRGIKDQLGKAMIEKLANILNGAVGASRAVTESGLFPATLQIGQTGKVVSPQLYIAIGISGAIQHVSGMANSKVIVAINKDADAPIFQVADYGIVGDLNKIVPAFIQKIEQAG